MVPGSGEPVSVILCAVTKIPSSAWAGRVPVYAAEEKLAVVRDVPDRGTTAQFAGAEQVAPQSL
jgi:hypothetical protein